MSDQKHTNRVQVTAKVGKKYTNNVSVVEKSTTKKMKEAGEKMWEMYKLLDMFGKPIMLKYNGKEVYKSGIGATITVSALTGMILFFIYSFIFFVRRDEPIFSSVSETRSIPTELKLSDFGDDKDQVIGIDIMNDKQESIFHPEFFSFKIEYLKRYGFGDSETTDSYLNEPFKCTEASGFRAIQRNHDDPTSDKKERPYYDIYNMLNNGKETAKCFSLTTFKKKDTGRKIETILEGNEITINQNYINIIIEPCKSGGEVECENIGTIREKMNHAVVRFYFTSQQFLTNDTIIDPVSNSTAFYAYSIQSYLSKKVDIFTQSNTVQDYYDIFRTKPSTRNIFSFSRQQEQIEFVNDSEFGNFPLIQLKLKVDSTRNTYQRKYMNIKEFFVSVVGIMNGIIAVGRGIGMFLNNMLLKVDLINKGFYMLVADENEKKKKDGKPVKPSEKNLELAEVKENNRAKDDGSAIDKSERRLVNSKSVGFSKDLEDSRINRKPDPEYSLSVKSEGESEEKEKEQEDVDEDVEYEPKEKAPNNTRTYMQEGNIGKIRNKWTTHDKLIMPTKKKRFEPFTLSFKELLLMKLPIFQSNDIKLKKQIFNDCGERIDAFFEIGRIVNILREYEDLRNVVLSNEEYRVLKQLATPKIEIFGEGDEREVRIKKVEKIKETETNLEAEYSNFVKQINKMLKRNFINNVENNLLHLHELSIMGGKNDENNKEEKN